MATLDTTSSSTSVSQGFAPNLSFDPMDPSCLGLDRSVEDWQADPNVDALTDAIMAAPYVPPTSAQILATIR